MTREAIGYPIIHMDKALRLGALYQSQIESSPVKLRQLELPKNLDRDYVTHQTIGDVKFDDELLDKLADDFFDRTRKIPYSEARTEMANTLWEVTQSFPILVVQDLDFWRYLSLVTFRNYVFKFKNRMEPGDFLGTNTNVNRARLIEALRLGYRLAEKADDPYLTAINDSRSDLGLSSDAQDSYISNIIRVEWAKHESAGRAFLDSALAEPAVHDENQKEKRHMNFFQQRVAALQNNVLFAYLEQDEAKDLFMSIKEG